MGNNEQESFQNNNDSCDFCGNFYDNNNVPESSTTKGRLCHIIKRPDFDGYGFNLHSEKIKPGQYIGKVDTNSPAEAAGLREGYQILEVNGVNIGSETHKQVVQRIKAIANEVRLLLLDPCNANELTTSSIKTFTNSRKLQCTNNVLTSTKSQIEVTVQPNIYPTASGKETKVVEMQASVPFPLISNQTTPKEEKESSISVDSTTKEQTMRNTFGHASTPSNAEKIELNYNFIQSEVPNQTTVAHFSKHADNLTTQIVLEPELPMVAAATTGHPKPSLNLNLTAAEMRAKLLAKKKYDPKNESVDLKKKFEIIQKL